MLPSGINKAAGLKAALEEMKVSPHNVVAVGDAENDHAFMNISECSVAVANALPSLKDRVDFVTEGSRGDGVIELIDKLIASDLSELDEKLKRENIHVGKAEDDVEISIKPYGTSALLAGTSGGGKSTLATGIIERIAEAGYQFCIIDPEGDYENFDGAVILGDADRAPSIDEIQSILEQPNQNLIINLLGVGLHDRPKFFAELLPALLELRSRTGRPHWIIVDEAHHLLPASLNTAAFTLPQQLNGLMMITVHPDHVAPAAVSLVNTLLTVGQAPENNIKLFCETVGDKVPELSPQKLEKGQALIWYRGGTPQRFHFTPGHTERRRHVRKYAEGQLGEDKSFYFKGKEGKLNLRAQNLILFTQIAEGVDDDTWLYHLHEGDYSQWFREAIKDNSLAEEVEEIEKNANGSASDSRQAIKAAIEERYTLPA
ncbi:HAD family hydrolase [Calothrix sp. NIES-4071]|nr:HAD family hydrolase [Calothrix sp. NIES-4071]BAZ63215.1 HAD family hydrolase [Calothrix sp. NIES-4105]